MKKNKLLVYYLKYRIILLPLIPIEIIRNPFYKNFVDSSDSIREFFKYIFFKSKLLDNITDNLVVILNGQVQLLLKSILLVLVYLAGVGLLSFMVHYHQRKIPDGREAPASEFLLLLLWSAVYCFGVKAFPPATAFGTVVLLGTVYAANFMVFNSEAAYSSGRKKFLAFIFAIGFFWAEWFCFPLYIKLIYSLENKKLNSKHSRIIQWAHFYVFAFMTLLLFLPLKSPLINDMRLLQKGRYYDLQYYEKGDALIVLNDFEGQVEEISVKQMAPPRVLYKARTSRGTEEAMGEWVSVNNEKQELYFTDRSLQQLVIMDLPKRFIKKIIPSALFDAGDNYITYLDDYIYGLTEEGLCVYKINKETQNPANNILSFCIQEGEGALLIPDPNLDALYATNWNAPSGNFFIYKIDANNLAVLDQFHLTSPGTIMVSEDGERLYCGVSTGPVNLFTIDARTMRLLDRFIIPYGTENGALDASRELLFAANHFTNIVEIIDIKTKKTLKYFRAGEGDSYIRRIIVDSKHKRFFVTVFNKGIYVGEY